MKQAKKEEKLRKRQEDWKTGSSKSGYIPGSTTKPGSVKKG